MDILTQHVEEFLKQINIDLNNAEESFTQDKKAALLLTQYLRNNSINAELIKVSSFLKGGFNKMHSKWSIIDRNLWRHYMVKVDDVYIDITWNQFVPNSKVPVFFNEEDITYYWESQYVV